MADVATTPVVNTTELADATTDPEAVLEELFKDRFTERDEDYMATVNRPPDHPPCIQNWYTKPKRVFDYSRDGQRGQHHGYQQQRHHGRYHDGGYDQRNRHHGYQSRGTYHHHGNRDRHDNSQYGNRDSAQGPSRAFYPGMRQEEYQKAHSRYHPYSGHRGNNR